LKQHVLRGSTGRVLGLRTRKPERGIETKNDRERNRNHDRLRTRKPERGIET